MREVRFLDDSDAEAYRELRLEALQNDPLAFGASYEDWLTRPLEKVRERIRSADGLNFTVGAFADRQLVGVSSFARNEGAKFRHSGWVGGVYVSPAYRGRGLSRRMMEVLLERARTQEGLEQITLAVSHTQEAAKGLYRSLGFEVWGYEKHALRVGDAYADFEHMILWL